MGVGGGGSGISGGYHERPCWASAKYINALKKTRRVSSEEREGSQEERGRELLRRVFSSKAKQGVGRFLRRVGWLHQKGRGGI